MLALYNILLKNYEFYKISKLFHFVDVIRLLNYEFVLINVSIKNKGRIILKQVFFNLIMSFPLSS